MNIKFTCKICKAEFTTNGYYNMIHVVEQHLELKHQPTFKRIEIIKEKIIEAQEEYQKKKRDLIKSCEDIADNIDIIFVR